MHEEWRLLLNSIELQYRRDTPKWKQLWDSFYDGILVPGFFFVIFFVIWLGPGILIGKYLL